MDPDFVRQEIEMLVNAVTGGRHQELRDAGSCIKDFEFNLCDDFPTTTLDAEESDRWHQYPDEFV